MSLNPENIDDLLRCHKLDDPVIIEALVEQYRSPIYRFAILILNNPDEADDATQETLIKAAQHLGSYSPDTNFRAWLFSIAVNVCRGILRKQNRRKSMESILIKLHLPYSPYNPEQSVLQNESKNALWDAVRKLGEKRQLVVILRVVNELSIKEIASILGTNQKTVYSRLYDAFRQLRRLINSSQDNEQ